MANKSKLIILEGMECCGKSTQINLLKEYFKTNNKEFILVKEPGQTQLGKKLREILLFNDEPIDPLTQSFIFNACRSDIYEKIIIPSQDKDIFIIQDRAWTTTIVYQCFAFQQDLKRIEDACYLAIRDITPDLIIFLDIKMDKYMQVLDHRLSGRLNEKVNHFDRKELGFYQRAYDGYQYLANKFKDK
ncbi:MAG: dTMP kinase [Candidatus Paceibacterota bacterium]|jgi:dTMP kinase